MKASSIPSVSADKTYKMRLDINKISLVGDVALNDEVLVKVKGRVTAIRGPEQSLEVPYDSKNKKEIARVYPGSLEVEIDKVEIQTEDQFAGLDEDEIDGSS